MSNTMATKSADVINTMNTNEDKTNNKVLDASQHIYGGAKNVWGFVSTDFILTKPFAKATEAVAGKVLDIASGGTLDFEKVDQDIILPRLARLDDDLLNPTLSHVADFVEQQITHGDALVRPVVMAVLHRIHPQDDVEKNRDLVLVLKEEETVNAPEVTMTDRSAVNIVPAAAPTSVH